MSSDSGGRWFENPVPIVMVALLAAGILVKTVPLESARPIDPDRLKSSLTAQQDVEARLWQDPLAAIEKAKAARSEAARQASTGKQSTEPPPLKPPASPADVKKKLEDLGQNSDVTVLAVSVFGGSFDAAAEWRRRSRFAVLSALDSQNYRPVNPEALGYYETDNGKLYVPFEWFERSAVSGDQKSPASKILVLWLDEEKFAARPYTKLLHVFNELIPSTSKGLNVRLVGPMGSGVLVELIKGSREARLEQASPGSNRKVLKGEGVLDVFSPTATISNCNLNIAANNWPGGSMPRESMPWNCFMPPPAANAGNKYLQDKAAGGDISHISSDLSIVRTTLTDDVLSAALLWELWHRGVNRSHAWPVNEEAESTASHADECKDGIVLISEWDTEYARSLSRNLTEGFKGLCKTEAGTEPPVRTFIYFRGLDGVPAGADARERKTEDKRQKEESDEFTKLRKHLEDAAPEHAEGRNQYDYLRRLIFEIERLDRDEKFAEKGIKAIGLLGNDVYDKLVILMALRGHFKDKIFFTTDLDARYLHADQKDWTRNLVVASNFGFALDPKLQKSALPFRDTYQTAIYLAALMALETRAPKNKPEGNPGKEEPEDRYITPMEWTGKMAHWLRPMTFEVGRTEAVHLASPSISDLAEWINGVNPEGTLMTSKYHGACATGNWTECENIQPFRSSRLAFTLPQIGMISMIFILGTALIVLASRYVQQSLRDVRGPYSRRHIRAKSLLVGVAAIFLLTSLVLEIIRTSINESLEHGVGEPFLWLEGISVWPSLTIRFFWILLMAALILLFAARLKQEARSISSDFRLGRPSTPVLERSKLSAMFTGPYLDFLSFDKNGKRNLSRGERNQKKVEIATLWQNYVRATSWREKLGWILFSTMVVMVFATVPFFFYGMPAFPHRGKLVMDLHQGLVFINAFIMWVTIFWTSYEARACAQLIDALNRMPRRNKWPRLPEGSTEARFRATPEALADYLDFRLIVRATQRIQSLIYLPFISIVLIVIARSDLLDAMDIPLPIIFVIGLSLCYAIYAQILLRKCALSARAKAIQDYEAQLFAVEKREDNSKPAPASGETADPARPGAGANDAEADRVEPGMSAEQVRLLIERIQNTRSGTFAPLVNQPVLQALLLPFGGYGGVQLIEYLFS